MADIKEYIEEGRAILGIELGSTRIKAVLIDENHKLIASGGFGWENRLENGIWTYHLDDIHNGLQACYRDLKENVRKEYGVTLTGFAAIGISGMMHGYLPLDKEGRLLAPFRTWRNNNAAKAAEELSRAFNFNMPDRWSGAQLYQSIIDDMDHVKNIDYLTTLAGYIHWRLTGERVLSVGDASGMFPIDTNTNDFDDRMLNIMQEKIADKNYPWKLRDILPKVLVAGENAGYLTEDGAKFLDPSGNLKPGIPFCAPEGDCGTGMVATNSVAPRTGNISAGTSGFIMIVLEKPLSKMYREIDIVQTPDGYPVGQAHANTCTSDLNAWVELFGEFAKMTGTELSTDQLFGLLYRKALEGDADCGGLVSYGYYAGEFLAKVDEGRPMFVRKSTDKLSLSNFMRSHLYSSVALIRIGTDIMTEQEGVKIDRLTGHGGLFKTPYVGQKILSDALNTPVSVMETAGEGGAWGIALLAAYLIRHEDGETLADYLNDKVFSESKISTVGPDKAEAEGYTEYIKRYKAGLEAERAAAAI